jgi:biopolymer transport protein ExbD
MIRRRDRFMASRAAGLLRGGFESFNMTPVIDIVFQLIIFFSLVCRFIEAENFPVSVPDNCRFARSDSDFSARAATITVMKGADDKVNFAVGSEKVSGVSAADIIREMSVLIDDRLNGLPAEERIVTLRIDKNVRFAEAQYALAAVAQSIAADIQIAALKGRPD